MASLHTRTFGVFKMIIDPLRDATVTLLVAGSMATAVASMFLLRAWRIEPQGEALLWWAASLLCRTVVGLLLAIGFAASNFWLVGVCSLLLPANAVITW